MGTASFKEDVTLNNLAFSNPEEGWIAGEFETILYTADGGKTWKKQWGDKEGRLLASLSVVPVMAWLLARQAGSLSPITEGRAGKR